MGDSLATTNVGQKEGGAVPLLGGEGAAGSLSNSVAWAEAYLRTKWYIDPSSHLATTDIVQKLVGCCAPLGEELGPHLTHRLGRGVPPYQVASCSI